MKLSVFFVSQKTRPLFPLTIFKNAFILLFITLIKFTDVINKIKKW